MKKTTVTIADDKKTLIIEREFSAPRSKVWAAFTEKDIFVKWYAPDGWSTSVKTFDFKVDGETFYGMTCEDKSQGEWFGHTEWAKFIYIDINAETTYSFSNHSVDEEGVDQEGMPVSRTKMQFSEMGTSTKVVATDVYESEADLQAILEMGAVEGIKQTWDGLGAILESQL